MSAAAAPDWDRFAHWRRGPAVLLLAALLGLLAMAALAPAPVRENVKQTRGFAENLAKQTTPAAAYRDKDLALYDRVTARLQRGENYYDVIVEEHRRSHFPVRPGLAVRLPTLAYINAWLGEGGQIAAAILLLLAVLIAWWRRLGEEPGGGRHRLLAMALLALGATLGLNRYFFALHELWAGMLLALAFALHRPGRKWLAALIVAALAVAIREHALPFVLLMAAMALWRRDWKEGAAWVVLALLFLAGLAWHLQLIAAQTLPSDGQSVPWLALRGMTGWISNVQLSGNLRFLPQALAGPLIVLALFGWAGWRTSAGAFATLLQAGYGVLFAIAGRNDNYYWGAVVAPTLLIGLAFAPMAARSLIKSAVAK